MQTQPQDQNGSSACPNLEVRVVIFGLGDNRLQVLLQPSAEFAGRWELPGGPVLKDQSLETSAGRVLAGCVRTEGAYLEQLYTYGDTHRHPNRRLITLAYFVLVPADAFAHIFNESGERWFPSNELPPLVIDHETIVHYALRRLRYKLEYSAVGFELLPDFFTLSQLQHTYEIILGEKLDKRNFRRRILQSNIIEPTPHLLSGEGRPARLYRYRPDAIAEVKARRLFP